MGSTLITPGGRNAKRKARAKTALVKFRCSSYQKKLLRVKAKRSGLNLSQYCRRVAFEIGKGKAISHTRASMLYGWNQEMDAQVVDRQHLAGDTPGKYPKNSGSSRI